MKAKAIAAEILEGITFPLQMDKVEEVATLLTDRASKALAGMVRETATICAQRGVKTPEGYAGVVKQQHEKWAAVCRQVEAKTTLDLFNRRAYLWMLHDADPQAIRLAEIGGFIV